MLYWLDGRFLAVKWKVKRALRGLRDDERGLSGVVVAVMLILVAILASAVLWDTLENWITETWNNVINPKVTSFS